MKSWESNNIIFTNWFFPSFFGWSLSAICRSFFFSAFVFSLCSARFNSFLIDFNLKHKTGWNSGKTMVTKQHIHQPLEIIVNFSPFFAVFLCNFLNIRNSIVGNKMWQNTQEHVFSSYELSSLLLLAALLQRLLLVSSHGDRQRRSFCARFRFFWLCRIKQPSRHFRQVARLFPETNNVWILYHRVNSYGFNDKRWRTSVGALACVGNMSSRVLRRRLCSLRFRTSTELAELMSSWWSSNAGLYDWPGSAGVTAGRSDVRFDKCFGG